MFPDSLKTGTTMTICGSTPEGYLTRSRGTNPESQPQRNRWQTQANRAYSFPDA